MPAKALVFALLLSFSSLAVTALSLAEEPLRDLPRRVPDTLTISRVNWRMEATNTITLQLCADETIPDGQAVLLWGVVQQDTIEEIGDDGDPNCSTFQMKPGFRLPAEPTFYQLSVKLENAIVFEALGSIEFAMTAQTSILVCGESQVTKLSWTTESPITYAGECITTGKTGVKPFDTDCYIDLSFSDKNLCFDIVDPPVRVCLNELIADVPSGGVAGRLSVNYLAYGELPVLSLNYDHVGQDPVNMRAIVRLAAKPAAIPGQPGLATVYDCPDGSCTMVDGIVPVYETYEVCAEARGPDGNSLQTDTTKIIDLNLIVFVGGTNVLEFAFANGLENKKYTASLSDTASPDDPSLGMISVDCTAVAEDHTCFGFFSTDIKGTFYVALSDENESNKIIATYTEP